MDRSWFSLDLCRSFAAVVWRREQWSCFFTLLSGHNDESRFSSLLQILHKFPQGYKAHPACNHWSSLQLQTYQSFSKDHNLSMWWPLKPEQLARSCVHRIFFCWGPQRPVWMKSECIGLIWCHSHEKHTKFRVQILTIDKLLWLWWNKWSQGREHGAGSLEVSSRTKASLVISNALVTQWQRKWLLKLRMSRTSWP